LDDSNAGLDPLLPDRAGNRANGRDVEQGAAGVPGDPREWVAANWDAVYKLVYRFTANRHDAEDLTQETFLRAIERQATFRSGTNLRAWLLRIATNAFLDRQRRKKVMKITPLSDEFSHDSPAPGQGLEDQERHLRVAAAIADLPEVQRVIFVLRGDGGLSFREIGQSIGMTEETARWHMMQARRQLIAKLDGVL
jgi:RNA polymerase sigma-70 factor (ECF subfamily)